MWKWDLTKMEFGRNCDGTQMELGWKCGGTRMELKWNCDGTQISTSLALSFDFLKCQPLIVHGNQ